MGWNTYTGLQCEVSGRGTVVNCGEKTYVGFWTFISGPLGFPWGAPRGSGLGNSSQQAICIMDIPLWLGAGVHWVSGLGQLWARKTHLLGRHGSRCLKLVSIWFFWWKGERQSCLNRSRTRNALADPDHHGNALEVNFLRTDQRNPKTFTSSSDCWGNGLSYRGLSHEWLSRGKLQLPMRDCRPATMA